MPPKASPLFLALLVLASGCIHQESTVVRDVERAKAEFENEAAARIFYEALSRKSPAYARAESTTKVEVPIVFDHKRHVVSGTNAAFNEGVRICDSNKDGRITEMEAKIYAEYAR
jgi:hypothetical protein